MRFFCAILLVLCTTDTTNAAFLGVEGNWVYREHNTPSEEEWLHRFGQCPLKWSHACNPPPKRAEVFKWRWDTQAQPTQRSATPHRNAATRRLSELIEIENLLDERIDGKGIGFVGDSLVLNFFTSFVCMLHASGARVTTHPPPKSPEFWGFNRAFQKRVPVRRINVTLTWPAAITTTSTQRPQQPQRSVTLRVRFEWAPYLIEGEDIEKGDRVHPPLDWERLAGPLYEMLKWDGLTHLILGSGAWWRSVVLQGVSKYVGYGRAISRTLDNVLSFFKESEGRRKRKKNKPHVVFMTTSHGHFSTLEWDKGGTCNQKEPVFNQTMWSGYASTLSLNTALFNAVQQWQTNNSHNTLNNNRHNKHKKAALRVDVLDGFNIADARADAHPIPTDCVHFCEPSVASTWMRFLLQHIL